MDPAALALLALVALVAAPVAVVVACALSERRRHPGAGRSWRELAELHTSARAPGPRPGAAFAGTGAMGFTRRAP